MVQGQAGSQGPLLGAWCSPMSSPTRHTCFWRGQSPTHASVFTGSLEEEGEGSLGVWAQRCIWGPLPGPFTAADVSGAGPAISLQARPGLPSPRQGFHTQENHFLVRRLEGISALGNRMGPGEAGQEQRARPGAGGGTGGSVTVNQGADPSNPASRLR